MKKLLILPVIISIFSSYIFSEQTLFLPKNYNISDMKLTPKNTIILSDMHEVFMKPIPNRIISTIWNYNNKMGIIRHANLHTIKTTITFLLGKIGILSPITNEEDIIKAAQQAHNDALVDIIIKGGSAYEPMPATIKLYKYLHMQGYQIDLGSNVASTVFASFRKKYPELFDSKHGLFTNYHVITTDIVRKPSITYFESYNETYNKTNKHVIFVDDKKENVLAAQKAGMVGIVFVNAQQLQVDLQILGITTTVNVSRKEDVIRTQLGTQK